MVATVVVVAGPVPAPAQAPPAPPVVSLREASATQRTAWVDCDGVRHVGVTRQASLAIERTEVGAADPEVVEVGLAYSGSLADDLVDPPGSVSVAPGGDLAHADLEVARGALGTLTVTVEPGPGYVVGAPAEGSFTLDADVSVIADCTRPLALWGGSADQRIEVGQQPAPLGVAVHSQHSIRVEGTLPPGLTLEKGVWVGTATTPGTYTFRVIDTFDALFGLAEVPQVLGTASADVRIEVVGPAGSGPPAVSSSPAAPADPVAAPARFTG